MKLFNALTESFRQKDTTSVERFEVSKVRITIEALCEKYLVDLGDVFKFEALPSAIDATLECLESPQFLEKYEFAQISDTVFAVRLHEIDIF